MSFEPGTCDVITTDSVSLPKRISPWGDSLTVEEVKAALFDRMFRGDGMTIRTYFSAGHATRYAVVSPAGQELTISPEEYRILQEENERRALELLREQLNGWRS